MTGQGRSALLVEGGALRGSYAVGVLRTLFDHGGPDQFDAIVAASSGVFAATYFAARQVEEMESTWRDMVHGSQLISFRRMLRGRAILGLDYLIDLIQNHVYLDLDKVHAARPSLTYVLTDYRTGLPHYADAKCPAIFDLMRASAALPWLYPRRMLIGGVRYCDGSFSDPLPVGWLIEQGFTEIVAILTTPREFNHKPLSRVGSHFLFPFSRGTRAAARAYHTTYAASEDLLYHPPAGVRTVVLRPSGAATPVLSRDQRKIIEGIELGKRDTRRAFAALFGAAVAAG